MTPTIIITNDFSESAHNAINYTCKLVGDSQINIQLLHIYTMPVNYTSDAVALSSLKDDYDINQDNLDHDVERTREKYPHLNITGKTVVGGLIETLRDQIDEVKPEIIVMGAVGDYENLWMWDSELLNSLTSLAVPVLLVPTHVAFTPITNIGFACDYRTVLASRQVSFLKWLVGHTKAGLHVVHVSTTKLEVTAVEKENEAIVHDLLDDVKPQYYGIENPHVIESIASFVKEHNLDFLVVIPHSHGVWYNIFHQSHTKQLAKLNNMPILALHD